MANQNGPVWKLKPHTKAKHMVLEEYLKAWFPILSTWNNQITFNDGFAGPGKYSGGEEGSPLIAIRTAINHSQRARFKKIFFAFIEKDPKRAEILKQTIKVRFPNLPSSVGTTFGSMLRLATNGTIGQASE